jgi:hypothetical protein
MKKGLSPTNNMCRKDVALYDWVNFLIFTSLLFSVPDLLKRFLCEDLDDIGGNLLPIF